MKKYILTLLIIICSFNAYSQRRLMYIQKEGKKHLTYRIQNRYRVKITLANGQEIKGRINLLNDTQFYIGKDTIHIDSVAKIRRIKKSTRTAAEIFLPVGVAGATLGYLLIQSNYTDYTGIGSIIVYLAGVALVGAGSLATFTGGLLFLTDIHPKNIDGVKNKLVIKTIPKKPRPWPHK